MTPPLDGFQIVPSEDPDQAALNCAIAAMRRESVGDRSTRAMWADLMVRRDHSSPSSRIQNYFRPPEGCHVLVRRDMRLEAAEAADLAATRAMLAYWARLGGGFVPSKKYCDPVMDRPLLTPWLFLADLAGEDRFIFRLAGAEVERFAGRSLRGRDGRILAAENSGLTTAAIRLMTRTKAPAMIRGVADYSDGRERCFEYAFAPLTTDYGDVRFLVAALGLDAPGKL